MPKLIARPMPCSLSDTKGCKRSDRRTMTCAAVVVVTVTAATAESLSRHSEFGMSCIHSSELHNSMEVTNGYFPNC